MENITSNKHISNIKNFISSSKDKLKDKFKNIFIKDQSNSVNQQNFDQSKINNQNNKNSEKKPIFSIEEDDVEKIYNYNLHDDEDEDEDIYDEDEEEEIQNSPDNQNDQKNLNDVIDNKNKWNNEINQNFNSPKKNRVDNDREIDLEIYDEEMIDPNFICHRLYQKDYIIDLENLPYVQFYKLKEKNKVFSFIGIGKNQKFEENYLALFDENFLYIMKDKENINHLINNIPNLIRKCHKFYDLKTITNISTKNLEDNKMSITMVFSIGVDLEKLEYKTKTLYFFIENAKKFIQILNFYLKKLNIEINFAVGN